MKYCSSVRAGRGVPRVVALTLFLCSAMGGTRPSPASQPTYNRPIKPNGYIAKVRARDPDSGWHVSGSEPAETDPDIRP
jgi:hypothetical protein